MNDKWFELVKWFISSVCIVTVTLIIDAGFKEREAGIKELEVYDKYVDIILEADNIEQRWKLCQYFSIVTPTERLRERWIAYKDTIKNDYYSWKSKHQIDSTPSLETNNKPLIYHNQENIEDAKFYEHRGFESILSKELFNSLENFKLAEKSKNGYHNCYEIYKYLEKNKSELQSKTSPKWRELQKKLITDWSWGVPEDIKTRLKTTSENI